MDSLASLLNKAAIRALLEAHDETGTERVRLMGLADVLHAEARVARQKQDDKTMVTA